MYINASGKRYFIIKNVYQSPEIDIMSCLDVSAEVESVVTINRLKNKEIIRTYFNIFAKSSYQQSEFLNYFSVNSELYLVFRGYSERNLFTPNIAERFKLSEKVLLSLNILSKVMLSDMPPDILFQLLKNKNINYDGALNINFNYYLDLSDQRMCATESDIYRQFGYILRALFGKSASKIDEIKRIIHGCISYKYTSYSELYFDLKAFSALVFEGEENFSLISSMHRKKEVMAARVKNFLKVASLFVIICGIILALAWNDRSDLQQTAILRRIGTVSVDTETITATADDPYERVMRK